MKKWLFRSAAVYFIISVFTGIVLYFRPGGSRPGLYSNQMKEWFVMIHNGEWASYLLFGRPLYSGLLLGGVVLATLVRHALRGLLMRRRAMPAPVVLRQTTRRAA